MGYMCRPPHPRTAAGDPAGKGVNPFVRRLQQFEWLGHQRAEYLPGAAPVHVLFSPHRSAVATFQVPPPSGGGAAPCPSLKQQVEGLAATKGVPPPVGLR